MNVAKDASKQFFDEIYKFIIPVTSDLIIERNPSIEMTKTSSTNNPKVKSKEANRHRLLKKRKYDSDLISIDIQEDFGKSNPQAVTDNSLLNSIGHKEQAELNKKYIE